jgi:hypothetical protein
MPLKTLEGPSGPTAGDDRPYDVSGERNVCENANASDVAIGSANGAEHPEVLPRRRRRPAWTSEADGGPTRATGSIAVSFAVVSRSRWPR